MGEKEGSQMSSPPALCRRSDIDIKKGMHTVSTEWLTSKSTCIDALLKTEQFFPGACEQFCIGVVYLIPLPIH